MSQTVERVSSALELLTSFTTVMVCNDVMKLQPVGEQQQGVDIHTINIMTGHIVVLVHMLTEHPS